MERQIERRYKYFRCDSAQKFHIEVMKSYVTKKQEMDNFLEKLIVPIIKNKSFKILDACCGIGHIIYFLSAISPKSTFLGIDQGTYLIKEARELCKTRKNVLFEEGNVYDLPAKYPKNFDIAIIWKTISWLPYYSEVLKTLMAVSNKHIFLSGLFYEGDIDFEIRVREFKQEASKDGFNAYYNIYSLPRFKKMCHKLGAKNVEAYDFEIGIDIPRGSIDSMGTYTVRLENGKKQQISGAIIMPWKILKIDL